MGNVNTTTSTANSMPMPMPMPLPIRTEIRQISSNDLSREDAESLLQVILEAVTSNNSFPNAFLQQLHQSQQRKASKNAINSLDRYVFESNKKKIKKSKRKSSNHGDDEEAKKKKRSRDEYEEESRLNVEGDGEDDDSKKETCVICLEAYKDGEELAKLPCTHSFHEHCVIEWLSNHANTCPCCRKCIEDDKAAEQHQGNEQTNSSTNSSSNDSSDSSQQRDERPSSNSNTNSNNNNSGQNNQIIFSLSPNRHIPQLSINFNEMFTFSGEITVDADLSSIPMPTSSSVSASSSLPSFSSIAQRSRRGAGVGIGISSSPFTPSATYSFTASSRPRQRSRTSANSHGGTSTIDHHEVQVVETMLRSVISDYPNAESEQIQQVCSMMSVSLLKLYLDSKGLRYQRNFVEKRDLAEMALNSVRSMILSS